jgi:hypothetical protein
MVNFFEQGVLNSLLGVQPQTQPMGVLGAAMQAQPQAMAQPMQTQARPKFWQSPEFASTLSRLGANLAAASTQNEGFLDALSLASAQTAKDTEAARAQAAQNELLQAQIAKTRAESQPATPFSGTGFENQVASTYYNAYLQQGLSPLEAQIKAAQAVFNREPSYVTDAAGNLVPIPGRTLPTMGGAAPMVAPMAAPAARQPDAIDQATSALGFAPQTSGMVLPPPSGVGAPDATLFQGGAQAPQVGQAPRITAPQGAGPRTQQALDEAAGKGQIELNIEAAKKLQEKATTVGEDINAGYSALQSMNQMLAASSEAFSTQGLPQGVKVAAARLLAPNDPSIQRQLAATAQLGASRVQAFGPMLKELVGPGAVTEAERANAMEAISKPGMNDAEIRAIISPLMEKARNRLKVLELEQQLLNSGQKATRKQIADQLGIDIETGLAKGQSSIDFVAPAQPQRVLNYNPQTGRFD